MVVLFIMTVVYHLISKETSCYFSFCYCHVSCGISQPWYINCNIRLFYIFCRSLSMESKFSHMFQRDNSVSMLRVKMSRRRSQTQKENRERTVNTRRQLEKLMELDVSSLDASVAMANMSVAHERTLNGTAIAKSKNQEQK